MKSIAIIPARYASVRFPGKLLATIGDKPIIVHTWERTCAAGLDRVVVATDDSRIGQICSRYGAEVVYTRSDHSSGTDRCAEAARLLGIFSGIVVNVQGDEPMIHPEQIRKLVQWMKHAHWPIGTLAKRLTSVDAFHDPNVVKVVFGQNRRALYFSRSPIPHWRGKAPSDSIAAGMCYKHIGMYAYRAEVLQRVASLPKGEVEQIESLEQLRWLEAGIEIGILETKYESVGIDTPEDLQRLLGNLEG